MAGCICAAPWNLGPSGGVRDWWRHDVGMRMNKTTHVGFVLLSLFVGSSVGCRSDVNAPVVVRLRSDRTSTHDAGWHTTSCVVHAIDWGSGLAVGRCRVHLAGDLPGVAGGSRMLHGPLRALLKDLRALGVSDGTARISGHDWRMHVAPHEHNVVLLQRDGGMLFRVRVW